jgi:hypothetical protein
MPAQQHPTTLQKSTIEEGPIEVQKGVLERIMFNLNIHMFIGSLG